MIQVAAAIIFLAGVLQGWYGLAGTIACLFVVLSCAGLTYPNAAAIALAPFSHNAGTASALLGFVQIGIGAVISSGVGLIAATGSLAVAVTMCIAASVALLILLLCGKAVRTRVTEHVNVHH